MSNGGNLTLSGRRAVVTGAGRGIGRSIALELAGAGADVAVTARTAVELEQLVTQIQAMGRQSLAISCDVTDTEQVQRMAKTAVEGLGGIDILVNNAGNAGSHKFLNHPDDLWQRMLALCPPAHHELLQLKRHGLTLVEIAQRTGLHEGSVRRILRQLARQMAVTQEPLPESPS